MHKNVKVMDIEMDEFSNIISLGKIYSAEHMPVGTYNKIGADRKALNYWWTRRSIPASRHGIADALESIDISSSQELIQKCLGLSLSDQYWVLPHGEELDWHEINFFENNFSEDIGDLLFVGKTSDSLNLFSPDNTADGNLKKKWKISAGKRILIKSGSNPFHQEVYNEVIASLIADKLGITHTPYYLIEEHNDICCYCEDFITPETELVPASHIIKAFKKRNDISEYEFYVDCCEKLGVADIRRKLEEMLVLDYIIGNEDRHFNNFGLIRNATTLEWLGAAPIYDCGNSLWFNKLTSKINAGDDIKTPLWKKTTVGNLSLVTDLSWLDISKLDGIEKDILTVFEGSEYIEEERASAICNALLARINRLNLYHT
jgi:hypothetical protein